MKRRVGCLILALLFALLFIFWGMMCRLALPISPEEPAQPVPVSQEGRLELHSVPDVVDVEQPSAAVQVHAYQVYAPGRFGIVGKGTARLQELFGDGDQPSGPDRGDGLFGLSVSVAATGLDFYEDKLVALYGNDVHLSGAAAEVGSDDPVTFSLQV